MHVEIIDAGFIAELLAIIMTMFVGTLLVEAIAFTSATATSLKSRARELAVLRAVGLTRRRMVGMLAAESAVVAISGAIIGSLTVIPAVRSARRSPALAVG